MTEYCYHVIRLAYSQRDLTDVEKKWIVKGYNEEHKNEILNLCKTKKYYPVVGKLLSSLDLDANFWRGQYEYYKNRNKHLLVLVSNLFNDFKKQGLEKIFLYENFGALLASETDIGLYASGDVDLCAQINDQYVITSVLQKHGFQLMANSNFSKIFRLGYEGKLLDESFRINVMFVPLVRYKLPIRVDYSKVIKWNEMRVYKDTNIVIPSKEALLYLCLLRISVHGYTRSPDMRLYIDIYNALIGNPDWDRILEWALHDNNIVRISVVSIIAHELFAVEIPVKILSLEKSGYPKITKLLKVVCDRDKKILNLNMSKLEMLKMEIYSNNQNILQGIVSIVFPNSKWLSEYYSNSDKASVISNYMNYLKHVLNHK